MPLISLPHQSHADRCQAPLFLRSSRSGFSVAAPPVKSFTHLACRQFPCWVLASLRGRHVGRHSMGSEDEVEQSVKRAYSGSLCRACTPRAANSPRPSSPAGTSLLKLVLQLSGSCRPRTPAKLRLFDPHAVQNDRQLAGNSDCCFRQAAPLCYPNAPSFQAGPPLRVREQRMGGFIERCSHQRVAAS